MVSRVLMENALTVVASCGMRPPDDWVIVHLAMTPEQTGKVLAAKEIGTFSVEVCQTQADRIFGE